MKVALVLLPEWQGVTPPLALAYLKAAIQEGGHECKALDFAIEYEKSLGGVKRQIMTMELTDYKKDLFRSFADRICAEKPDVIAFSLLAENLDVSQFVCAEVKKKLPHVKVIGGGAILTKPEVERIRHALQFCDVAIEGEAEHAIVELLNSYRDGLDPRKVNNVWFLFNGDPLCSGGDARLPHLDTLSFPNFDDFNFEEYLCKGRVPLLFSRGCILNCTFCTNKYNHRTQRTRSGQNVFQELVRNVERYKMRDYMFNDDSLISRITWPAMKEFCELVIANGYIMPWEIFNTRVDKLLVGDNVKLLRKAGLYTTTLGIESFSAAVQKDMGKASTPEISEMVSRALVENGIEAKGLFIYGYPSETDEDFELTLNWFKRNPDLYSNISYNVFSPNEKYHKDRPGIVTYRTSNPQDWQSAVCNLEQREVRFLRLVEVLERNRQLNPKAQYQIGDPHYTRHFSTWTQKDMNEIQESWGKKKELLKRAITA